MRHPTRAARAMVAVVALVMVVACAGDDARPAPVVPADPTVPTVATSPTVPSEPTDPFDTGPDDTGSGDTRPDEPAPDDTRPDEGPPVDQPIGDPEVVLTEVITLDRPLGLAWRAGDPTLYLVEQPGRVVAVGPDRTTRPVLDVTDLTRAAGERGLLGLAFSPDGTRAYTNHTRTDDGATVITEYAVAADGRFDRVSSRILLTIEQPFGNHNGGHLVTGPDGLLYIGMGDGGSGGDPLRLSLDLTSLHGKLLRIDPTPDGIQPYTVPPDNPFVGVDGALPEIFAIGLRNPWKFQFDPVTGDLWIADVGQNRYEEVNHVPAPADGSVAGAGLSFGWSAFEGTERFNDDVDPEGHTPPVLTYDHRDGECSISGGAPYRGTAIADLVGGYVYSDYCSGRVWVFDRLTGRNLLLARAPTVAAVLPGPDQELYVISLDGPVLRIDPA